MRESAVQGPGFESELPRLQALVLVGGRGTRLLPLTADTPKPVLTLVDRPFLSYMIDWLAGHGVDRIVFACGFLPDELRSVLGDGRPRGLRFTYLVEPEALGTAGAIRYALPHLDETFIALNGDLLADLDLTALWEQHHRLGAKATIGVHPVEDSSAYGLVDLAADGQVTGFHEKPQDGHAGPGLVNAGTYVLEREVIEAIPEHRAVSIEREVFPGMAGHGLYGLPLEGYWKDIGTPERFLEASWDIIEGRVATSVPVQTEGVLIDPDSRIHPEAEIGPRAVIGPGCEVEAGARIAGSVLLGEASIGSGATIAGSIFSPGVRVAAGATVSNAVVGRDEVIHA